ncbi:hypothetical protein H311_00590 [Anncaliia algerae PRA109]|nr:hypothetical protein H311_00590 [Anncaliia algerae PRA109]
MNFYFFLLGIGCGKFKIGINRKFHEKMEQCNKLIKLLRNIKVRLKIYKQNTNSGSVDTFNVHITEKISKSLICESLKSLRKNFDAIKSLENILYEFNSTDNNLNSMLKNLINDLKPITFQTAKMVNILATIKTNMQKDSIISNLFSFDRKDINFNQNQLLKLFHKEYNLYVELIGNFSLRMENFFHGFKTFESNHTNMKSLEKQKQDYIIKNIELLKDRIEISIENVKKYHKSTTLKKILIFHYVFMIMENEIMIEKMLINRNIGLISFYLSHKKYKRNLKSREENLKKNLKTIGIETTHLKKFLDFLLNDYILNIKRKIQSHFLMLQKHESEIDVKLKEIHRSLAKLFDNLHIETIEENDFIIQNKLAEYAANLKIYDYSIFKGLFNIFLYQTRLNIIKTVFESLQNICKFIFIDKEQMEILENFLKIYDLKSKEDFQQLRKKVNIKEKSIIDFCEMNECFTSKIQEAWKILFHYNALFMSKKKILVVKEDSK